MNICIGGRARRRTPNSQTTQHSWHRRHMLLLPQHRPTLPWLLVSFWSLACFLARSLSRWSPLVIVASYRRLSLCWFSALLNGWSTSPSSLHCIVALVRVVVACIIVHIASPDVRRRGTYVQVAGFFPPFKTCWTRLNSLTRGKETLMVAEGQAVQGWMEKRGTKNIIDHYLSLVVYYVAHRYYFVVRLLVGMHHWLFVERSRSSTEAWSGKGSQCRDYCSVFLSYTSPISRPFTLPTSVFIAHSLSPSLLQPKFSISTLDQTIAHADQSFFYPDQDDDVAWSIHFNIKTHHR